MVGMLIVTFVSSLFLALGLLVALLFKIIFDGCRHSDAAITPNPWGLNCDLVSVIYSISITRVDQCTCTIH